jgi:hypothetical protein
MQIFFSILNEGIIMNNDRAVKEQEIQRELQENLPKLMRSNNRRLMEGFFSASPLILFLFLLPRFLILDFSIGLQDEMLINALLVIPIAMICVGFYLVPDRWLRIINPLSKWITGGFLGIFATAMLFGFDESSLPFIWIMNACIIGPLISSIGDLKLQWLGIIFPSEIGDDRQYADQSKFLTGIGLVFAFIGTVFLFGYNDTIFFGILGFYFIISPLGDIFADKDPQRAFIFLIERGTRWKYRLQSFGNLLIAILALTFFSLSNLVDNNAQIGIGMLALGLGLGIHTLIEPIVRKNHIFPPWVLRLVVVVALFVYNLILIQNPMEYMTAIPCSLSGLILGFAVGERIKNVSPHLSNHPVRFAARLFILLILIIGSAIAGSELRWPAKYDPSMFIFGLPIIAVVGGIVVITSVLAGKIKKTIPETGTLAAQTRPIVVIPRFSMRIRNFMVISVLIALMLVPMMAYLLYQNSGASIHIKLSQTMYLVDGTPVDSVDLKERSAIILLNTPNPTGISHGELIRPGKSVRLGGYFYGLGNTTMQEAVPWIGNTLDVYSLGMCNGPFYPDNISTIKSINPNSRFYYMAFATTLFEDANNLATNGTWYGSHYPAMKFNETMHDWTLKYKNGTEAYGVRHNPQTAGYAHLMDLGKMEWADYFAWIYTQKAAEFGAEGVAIDEVMWRGYWDTKIEQLRDYHSVNEIIATCYQWLERLDNQTDMEIITQAFWDEAQVYQDGVWGEIAFRAGGQYGDPVDDRPAEVWYEKMNWEQIVDNLKSQGERNRSYIWAAWYKQGDRVGLEYSIGTYLMAKPNGCTSIVFHPHAVFGEGYGDNNMVGYAISNMQKELADNPKYFDLEMGDALGTMQLIQTNGGRYWQREFTNGLVLVNPFRAHLPGL